MTLAEDGMAADCGYGIMSFITYDQKRVLIVFTSSSCHHGECSGGEMCFPQKERRARWGTGNTRKGGHGQNHGITSNVIMM